jgi:hypothetical protein
MNGRFGRKEFLEAIFLDYYQEHNGFIIVKTVKRSEDRISLRYFPNLEILAKEQYPDDRDVYFGICPRERMKPGPEFIKYLLVLWADINIGSDGHKDGRQDFQGPREAAKAIREFPRPPSIMVNSGHGVHLYWLLATPVELSDQERAKMALDNINEKLGNRGESSLDAFMRLPDTVNTKVDHSFMSCKVTFINSGFKYSLQDFEDLGTRSWLVSTSETTESKGIGETFSSENQTKNITEFIPTVSVDEHDSSEIISDETAATTSSHLGEIDRNLKFLGEEVSWEKEADPVYRQDNEQDSSIISAHTSRSQQPLVRVPDRDSYRPRTGSRFFENLIDSKSKVEICFLGSNSRITGTLAWTDEKILGIKSGDNLYLIPVSSIAFLRTKY